MVFQAARAGCRPTFDITQKKMKLSFRRFLETSEVMDMVVMYNSVHDKIYPCDEFEKSYSS